MPITYTNRHGVTYVLCQRTSAAGKLRYVFARESRQARSDLGETVDTLPARFAIRESVNGIVSLVRDLPPAFSAEEVGVVDAAVRRHPKASLYRVEAHGGLIVVYERLGPAADDLASALSKVGLPFTYVRSRMRLAGTTTSEAASRFRSAPDAPPSTGPPHCVSANLSMSAPRSLHHPSDRSR